MIVDLTGVANDALADLAAAEAERHDPRTPPRRAAAALWAALITTKTVDSARSALDGFTTPETRKAAADLLGRLAASITANPKE